MSSSSFAVSRAYSLKRARIDEARAELERAVDVATNRTGSASAQTLSVRYDLLTLLSQIGDLDAIKAQVAQIPGMVIGWMDGTETRGPGTEEWIIPGDSSPDS